jgi:hypothetical protein
MENELAVLEQQCSRTVDLLLARHNWQLLEREEFVRRTLAQVGAGMVVDPHCAATHTYGLVLYTACSGLEGVELQKRGYQELFRYLYDCARWRYPEVCDHATQCALEATFTTFARCREPGAFLAFALQHLMDAARGVRRQEEQCPERNTKQTVPKLEAQATNGAAGQATKRPTAVQEMKAPAPSQGPAMAKSLDGTGQH